MATQTAKVTARDRAILGFGALKFLGFAPTHQAAVFGRKIRRRAQLRGIKIQLGRSMSKDDQERVDDLVDIGVGLDAISGGCKIVVRRFMRAKQGSLGRKSPKELLLSGDKEKIGRVVGMVRNITG
jgi:hypothetical protein